MDAQWTPSSWKSRPIAQVSSHPNCFEKMQNRTTVRMLCILISSISPGPVSHRDILSLFVLIKEFVECCLKLQNYLQ